MAKKPIKKPTTKELTKKLSGLVTEAKGLQAQGKTSVGLESQVARSESMLTQDKKQGNKSYSGSSSENDYLKSDAYKNSISGTPLISSQMGKKLVTTADQTMNNLAPVSAQPTAPVSEGGQTGVTTATTGNTTTPATPAPDSTANDYVTYVNETTGQEMTLKGSALTEQAKADAVKKGYTEASSEISGVKTTPEMAKLQREVDSATRETDSFMSRLESMLITDKELSGEVKQIGAKYKARQNEMRDINERKQVAMETLGVRTGARYTGGSGGIMGGILSEEERQGLMRIESIENDKQDAILSAKKAARDQNFTLYTKLAQNAEKKQEEKGRELQALKKAQAEQDVKIAEEKSRLIADANVVEIMRSGITDPLDVYAQMATDGTLGNYTLTDILGIAGNIESLKPKKVKEEVTEYSDVPGGGIDITQGFNFAKAKTADYKKLARELFPSDFGNKLLVELTDEELIEFVKDYTDDVNAQQQNIEPEKYFMDWAEKSGAVKPKEETGFEAKLNKLFAE